LPSHPTETQDLPKDGRVRLAAAPVHVPVRPPSPSPAIVLIAWEAKGGATVRQNSLAQVRRHRPGSRRTCGADTTGSSHWDRSAKRSDIAVRWIDRYRDEDISRLVGHSNTVVTETVYRQEIRPVMQEGAKAMDSIFPSQREA
jgi:integrase